VTNSPFLVVEKFAGTLTLLPVLLLAVFLMLPVSSRASGSVDKGQIVLYSYGPARVQITGPDGSRAGADLVTGGELEEIEGSEVMIEKAGDRSDGWTITLKSPASGVYRLNLLGTGKGGVVMDLEALDSSGRVRSSHVFRRVREGDSFEYALDYSLDLKSDNQLKEAVN
jgi:hypothetical protein